MQIRARYACLARAAWVGCLLMSGISEAAATSSAAPEGIPDPFFAMDTCMPGMAADAQLDLAKSLGYSGVSGTFSDGAAARALAEGAKKRGLKLFALYAGATVKRTGLEYDPRLKEAMDALKGFDTIIWLHVGSGNFPKSSPEGDEVAAAGLRELSDYAAAHKLRIALYPHTGEWIERVQDAVRVAGKVNRKNLGVTFNLCHCLMVGDEQRIPELLAAAKPRLFVVTINGADSGAAGTDWSRLIQTLDRGTYDSAPLLRQLHSLGYRGPIGLQGYAVPGDPKENLTRSMAAWRKLCSRASRGQGG